MLILQENPLIILLMSNFSILQKFFLMLSTSFLFIGASSTQNFYEEALTQFKKNDFNSSIKLLEKSIVFEPKHLESWILLGKSYSAIDNKDSASKYYKIAFNLNPENSGLNFLLGEISYQLNLIEEYNKYLSNLEILCPYGCEDLSKLKKLKSN